MKIRSIETKTYEDIEIEDIDDYWYFYRRYPSGTWEMLMGNSWEPCYLDEERLEQLYHDYKQQSA